MRERLQFMALGLGLAFALTAGATPVQAGFNASVATSVTPEAGGLYLYTYFVTDGATSTLGVSEFDMVVPASANLQSLTAPTGFLSLYTPGDVTVSFSSTDSTTDIAPGMTGVFSFTSLGAPTLGQYSLLTFDDTSFGSGDVLTGVTIAPGIVPEPASLILLGLGLGLGLPLAVMLIAGGPSAMGRRLFGHPLALALIPAAGRRGSNASPGAPA